jgi:D-alanine transaminase
MPPSPWLPGSVKHCSRAAWGLAARQLGVDEVLLTRGDGEVLEANRSNVLAVRGGALLCVPMDGDKLEGVTQGALLDAARAEGIPVREDRFYSSDSFDELYVCSTLKELAPVARLDGRPIGGGPVGRRLHQAFRRLVLKETGAGT